MEKVHKIAFKNCNTVSEAMDLMYTQETYLYNKVLDNLTYAFENDLITMPIVEIRLGNETKYHTLYSHRDKWDSFLEQGMKYFMRTEEYEKCAHIRDLINNLNKN
jgi:hypothetical protein